MVQEREVRERIALVLSGELSLAAFGEWLASESWNMFADNSVNEAIGLVAAINIRIDAYDDGALDAVSLRKELGSLLNDIVVSSPVDVSEALVNARPHFSNSRDWVRPQLRPVAA